MSAAELMAQVLAQRTSTEVRAMLRANPAALKDQVQALTRSDEDEVALGVDSEAASEAATLNDRTLSRASRTYQALSEREREKLSTMVKVMGGHRSDLDVLLG